MKKMKNWLVGVVAMMMVLCVVPVAHSQVSFLLGLGAGALLFGDGEQSGSSAGVLYTLPDVSKRVKNPLEIRLSSISGRFDLNSKGGGASGLRYWDLFILAIEKQDPSKFEILQIVRVFRGDDPHRAAIWFAYIEKEKVLSAQPPK